ncbi:MAG: hypothetical protein WBB01_04800 [Phormidesmis sp.]
MSRESGMDIERLEYIKNVNANIDWAYHGYSVGAYFKLNFKAGEEEGKGKGVDNHVLSLPVKSLIILSQKPKDKPKRYLTHVVELVNEGSEDKSQWEGGTWGTFRWAKVHWVANLVNLDRIPIDEEVMKVNWGWFDTKAKLLSSPGLMSEWGNIETLRVHLKETFIPAAQEAYALR